MLGDFKEEEEAGTREALCMFVDHFGIDTTRSCSSLLVVGASPGMAYDNIVFTTLQVSSVCIKQWSVGPWSPRDALKGAARSQWSPVLQAESFTI